MILLDVFSDLNPSQKEAVSHLDGPMVVFAGAGSGKTRIITSRIVHLIQSGVYPWQILAVTFTNKAAGEMRHRVESMTAEGKRCLITTFHSAASRWLREFAPVLGFNSNFSIYDDGDSTALIKNIVGKVAAKGDHASIVSTVKGFIQNAKTQCILPDELNRLPPHLKEKLPPGAEFIYREYQSSLASCNAMDFADLLLNMLLLLRHHDDVRQKMQDRYRFVLVDEFQDTNQAQFEILKHLCQTTTNLFVVGDDDQSIYSWRGANPTNITHFHRHYPAAKIVKLEQNYRCTANIVGAAGALVAHNRTRTPKTLFSHNADGELITVRYETDGQMEAWWVVNSIKVERDRFALDDVAIFYRTNAQSRLFEEFLTRENIPYTIFGSLEFYARVEIKDVLAYLRLLVNENDDVSLRRIINVPTRGIGPKALAQLEEKSRALQLPLFPTLKLMHAEENTKVSAKLFGFYQLIENLKTMTRQTPLGEILPALLNITGYGDYLKEKYAEQFTDKSENLFELGAAMIEFAKRHPEASLAEWLQTVTLLRSENEEKTITGVSLMTLHLAKGLEYPRVYLVGLEDGLLPHHNSLRNEEMIEEERRLLYVGITRAKIKLSLSHAYSRRSFDRVVINDPSRFLAEVPAQYLSVSTDNPHSFSQQMEFNSPAEPTDDPIYDYADASASLSLSACKKGALVHHPTYGKGVVQGIETTFAKTKVIVNFLDFGERKILPVHLSLIRTVD